METIDNSQFTLEQYMANLKIRITEIMSRPCKETMTYDILDTEKTKKHKTIVLAEKQRQMKIGEIWQEVLGNYNTCINLGVGHETGLDIISHPRKIAMELKNRTNTDNASSRKSNLDKLAKFKREHPDYTCVYGMVNDSTEEKTIRGTIKTIMHDGVEIKQYIGMELIRLFLGDDSDKIIDFIRNTI